MTSNSTQKNMKTGTKGGFVALMSAILISAILLGFAVTSGANSFHSRFNTLDSELKRISLSLAESCVNVALLKITQNYEYGNVDAGYPWPIGGETISVGSDTCTIDSMEHEAENPITHQKKVTIISSGEHSGAHSTIATEAEVGNPSYSVVSPPTCSFTASPLSITEGNSTTLQWSIGGIADTFSINRNIGGVNTIIHNALTGSPITDSPSASATYTATVSGPGGSTQCDSPRSVTVQPAPSCADTVMILDRTWTIFTAGANGPEKAAAKVLLNLYKAVIPTPKVGIVRFGDNTNGGIEAEIVPKNGGGTPLAGWLSTNFGDDDAVNDDDLFNATDIALNTQSSVGTNLADALNVASDELNGPRHTPGKNKVMLIVSDGQPNEPTSKPVATEKSLDAVDAAKVSGIEVFTIFLGSDPADFTGQELMAGIASGSIPITGSHSHDGDSHQNGSADDQANSPAGYASENSDNDHFFISTSPSGADMPGIFDTIGKLACPAAVPPPASPSSPPPPPPPPPPNIDLGSWQEL